MRADTHVGPEQNCSTKRPDTLLQLSRSSLSEIRLATHGRAIHFGTLQTLLAITRLVRFVANSGHPAVGEVPPLLPVSASLVIMSMMHIRDVCVGMPHRLMFVNMRMRLARRIADTVGMAMVLIMYMGMRVDHASMEVLMFVMFSHVQPYSDSH